jgi:hypothetical protein
VRGLECRAAAARLGTRRGVPGPGGPGTTNAHHAIAPAASVSVTCGEAAAACGRRRGYQQGGAVAGALRQAAEAECAAGQALAAQPLPCGTGPYRWRSACSCAPAPSLPASCRHGWVSGPKARCLAPLPGSLHTVLGTPQTREAARTAARTAACQSSATQAWLVEGGSALLRQRLRADEAAGAAPLKPGRLLMLLLLLLLLQRRGPCTFAASLQVLGSSQLPRRKGPSQGP